MPDKIPELLTPNPTSATAADSSLAARWPVVPALGQTFCRALFPFHAKAKRLSKFEVPPSAANLTKTDRQLTNDSNHGYRAHVRRMRSQHRSKQLLTNTQCPVGARFPEAGTTDLSRQTRRIRMLMRCDSLTSSRTTRSAVPARTPAPGDGTRMSVWVSVPPRPPLRVPTSTRSALSPAWSPSVAVSSPVPSCPPRCTVRSPADSSRAQKDDWRGRTTGQPLTGRRHLDHPS